MENVYTPSRWDVARAWFFHRLKEDPDLDRDPDVNDADDEFHRFIAKVKATGIREAAEDSIRGAQFCDREEVAEWLGHYADELEARA